MVKSNNRIEYKLIVLIPFCMQWYHEDKIIISCKKLLCPL